MLQSKLKITRDTIAYVKWKKCLYFENNNIKSNQPKKCIILYKKYIEYLNKNI
jgi:hypothetical protein